jgi:hypothetical protein
MYDLKSCGFFNAFNGRFPRIAADQQSGGVRYDEGCVA